MLFKKDITFLLPKDILFYSLFLFVLFNILVYMLTVGDKFPSFSLIASSGDNHYKFETISEKTFDKKWLIVLFWPKDFTFVCPTEILAFDSLDGEFAKNNAKLLGCSLDSEYVHAAWKESNEKLKKVKFPFLSDIKRELSNELGIIDKNAGVTQRAVFIVDDKGFIRYINVTDLNVGRNAKEVLRVLKALQTDELCPANWEEGDEVIKI